MSENEPGITELRDALSGILTASTLGYRLTSNPQGFILAAVYDALVGAAERTAAEIAAIILGIWRIGLDATVGTIGGVARDAGSALGSAIVGGLVGGINDIAVGLAASAGPLGIVVIPIVWAASLVLSVGVIYGIWRGYLLIRSAIV